MVVKETETEPFMELCVGKYVTLWLVEVKQQMEMGCQLETATN